VLNTVFVNELTKQLTWTARASSNKGARPPPVGSES
jgi:hypothetical protein